MLTGLLALAACEESAQAPSEVQDDRIRANAPYDLSRLSAALFAHPPADRTRGWRHATPAARSKPGKPAPLVNGSFERNGGELSNAFPGWTVVDPFGGDAGSWLVQTGIGSPLAGFRVRRPTDGDFAAMVDQFGPGTHILYQDVLVPRHGPAILSFDLFLNLPVGDYATPATLSAERFPNQQFRMDVMSPSAPVAGLGSGVLRAVYRTEPGDPPTSGYRTISVSLREFRGRLVRLRFAEVDNQGNLEVGIDRVTLGKHSGPVKPTHVRDRATAARVPFAPETGPFRHVLALGDDETSGPLPIGFEFSFFGHPYTAFNVSANGFVGFDPQMPDGCCDGGVIPSDDGLDDLIALAWTDLYPPGGGSISYETRGAAPQRRLIVSFTGVPVFGETATVTSQLILREREGAIEIHTAHQDAPAFHVVTQGVENLGGTVAAFVQGRVAASYRLQRDAVRYTTRSPGGGSSGP
jgi:hypothetical protein